MFGMKLRVLHPHLAVPPSVSSDLSVNDEFHIGTNNVAKLDFNAPGSTGIEFKKCIGGATNHFPAQRLRFETFLDG